MVPDPEASDAPTEPLWVLTGPTAAGKSGLALELAEQAGCEILSMDSMAVYRRMDLGTAKPSRAERARVPHHLLDLVEPWEDFDTARWSAAAVAATRDVLARGRRPLFVGGTPLYLMAHFKGMLQGPAADPALRAVLRERERLAPGALHEELQRRDPQAAGRIHRNDEKRLVRALEVLEQTGRPISAQQDHFERDGWARPCRIVALTRPRDELHVRVRARAEAMLDQGLLDEVRAILAAGGFSATAGAAIGYAECLLFLDRRLKDREELRNRIRRATHRLIRKQLTWLRRLPSVRWLHPDAGLPALRAAFDGDGDGPPA